VKDQIYIFLITSQQGLSQEEQIWSREVSRPRGPGWTSGEIGRQMVVRAEVWGKMES
jgi:hypothetical protein